MYIKRWMGERWADAGGWMKRKSALCPGVLPRGDAALWAVGAARDGRARAGGDEEGGRAAQRHHLRLLQQGEQEAPLTSDL